MGEKIEDIYNLFIELSGLSREKVQRELGRHIDALDLDIKNLSEDDIRKIMGLYLEELNWSIMMRDGDVVGSLEKDA